MNYFRMIFLSDGLIYLFITSAAFYSLVMFCCLIYTLIDKARNKNKGNDDEER